MSHLSYSLTVSALDSQEPTALVRCTIHIGTGAITSGIRVTLPDTLSEVASSIGCAVEEMLSTLLPMATAISSVIEQEDIGDDDE